MRKLLFVLCWVWVSVCFATDPNEYKVSDHHEHGGRGVAPQVNAPREQYRGSRSIQEHHHRHGFDGNNTTVITQENIIVPGVGYYSTPYAVTGPDYSFYDEAGDLVYYHTDQNGDTIYYVIDENGNIIYVTWDENGNIVYAGE